jgi:hypothetical protein
VPDTVSYQMQLNSLHNFTTYFSMIRFIIIIIIIIIIRSTIQVVSSASFLIKILCKPNV